MTSTSRLALALLTTAALATACDKARPIATGGGPSDPTGAVQRCTTCHGDASRPEKDPLVTAAPPRGADGGDGGAHLAHLHGTAIRGALACADCHVVPQTAAHSDGKVDVTFGTLARTGGAPATFTGGRTGTCAVYCHGATLNAGGNRTAPAWNGAALDCQGCHGYPPPSHAPTSTHCADCHPGTVKADGTIDLAGGLHVDGKVDVSGPHPAGWSDPTQHGPAAKQDLTGCQACHGTDFDGGTSGVSCNACHGGTAWQSNCTFCHGARVATYTAADLVRAAPPLGTRGETAETARAVGAHQAHVAAGALARAIACTECHTPVPTSLAHVGSAPITLGFGALAKTGGAAASFDGATCTTYCHGATLAAGGSNTRPSWTGGAAQAACGTCHGAPPPAPHTQSTDCGSCHTGYTATSVNVATHVDGKVDVNGMSCTSCHGDATRATNPAAPPVGTHGETATSTRAVGAHQAHLTAGVLGKAVACTECHTVPSSTSHSNGTVDMTWGTLAKSGGATPTWTGTTCTNYCHGSTLNAGGSNKAPSWTGGSAQAACGTCHGAPPPSPHVQRTDCGTCHPGYTSSSVNAATHVDGKLDVSVSCTSCHGDATRASSPAAPPAGTHGETATTTRAVGAHQVHLAGNALGAAVACTECHVVPTSNTHATGTVDMTWGTLAKAGSAVPTWTGTTCTNYCHGATLAAGGTNKAPSWTGGSAQAACGTCHGAPPPAPHTQSTDCGSCHTGYTATTVNLATHINGRTDVANLTCTSCHGDATRATNPAAPPVGTKGETATTTRAVGAHQVHLNGNALGKAVSCAECHTVPTSTTHQSGTVDMTWGTLARTGGATPTWTGTTCTNYCHGATLAAGGTNKAPSWTGGSTQGACGTCHGAPPPAPHLQRTDCGTCHPGYSATTVNLATHVDGKVDVVTLSCTTCHGDATRTANAAAPPLGTRAEASATTRAVGAHQVHLSGNALGPAVACTQCHAVPTSNTHATGTVDMTWGALAKANGATPTWTGSTCTNYCHGSTLNAGGTNTAPSWTGGSAQAACGTCHGAPPPAPHVQSTDCGSCHTGYTATSVNAATHLNGTVEVSGGSCTACHGDATRTSNPAAPPRGTHGETATTTRAVGAHQVHLAGNALGPAVACTECHTVPSSGSHSNGTVDMTWGTLSKANGAAPTWNGATCTNYCHGSTLNAGGTNRAPSWTGGSAQAACGTCHGAPPPAPHVQRTDCGTCHPGYTATTVNASNHVNGRLDVVTVTCTTCHGDATRATNGAAPPVGTRGETATTTRAVGAHAVHLNGNALAKAVACTECHATVTSTAHANGTVEMTWGTLSKTGGAAPTWTGSTCTNYCHGSTLNAGGTNKVPSWTGGSTQAACGTCHGAPPPAPHICKVANWSWCNNRTDCATCHTGYTSTSVNLATHVDGTIQSATTCTSCHGLPPSSGKHGDHSGRSCGDCHPGYTRTSVNATTHRDGTPEVGNKITSWNATTHTCTVTCHSSRTW